MACKGPNAGAGTTAQRTITTGWGRTVLTASVVGFGRRAQTCAPSRTDLGPDYSTAELNVAVLPLQPRRDCCSAVSTTGSHRRERRKEFGPQELVGAGVAEHRLDGLQSDQQVGDHGPVLDIEEI